MSEPVTTTRSWLDDKTPAEQMTAYYDRLYDTAEEYITADLEGRDAGRRRGRALDLMREIRSKMVRLAAEHSLPLPSTRFTHLLENENDAPTNR